MRGKSAIGLIALFAATALAGCTIDGKCGTWTIEGEPIENVREYSGQDILIKYEAKCCPCEEIRFIQVARLTVSRHGRPVGLASPHDGFAARMTANGWGVDQTPGNPRPFYCTGADGGTDPGAGAAGATGRPAELSDLPGMGGPKPPGATFKFEFLTAAVCLAGEGECNNKILDTLYWTFTIDADGTVTDVEARPSNTAEDGEFDDAVDNWNTQAAGSPAAPDPAHQDPAPPLHQ